MEKLYTVSKKQDWQLTVARVMNSLLPNFRLKLKKVGKTTRPFRYDLNQIPYNYTVEVTNRFKGLDLIDRAPEELWTEVLTLYRSSDQNHPQEKEMQNGKRLSEEALQIAVKRREMKGKGEKERYTHLNAKFQRIVRRDKKAFLIGRMALKHVKYHV